MKHIGISGGHYYVPDRIVTNEDITQLTDTSNEWIIARTGIEQRRISTGENTSELCAKTAARILESTGTDPEEIDIIITATVSPDYLLPSTACLVQSRIGARNAFAFDLGAACSGFVYALAVGEKLMRAGAYNKALILGGETLSKLTNWEDRATCVIFADGAGGVLLEAGERESFLAEDIHSDGDRGMSLTAGHMKVNNPFLPEGGGVEPGYPYISMDGREIFDFTMRNVPGSIKSVVEKAGIGFEDLKYIIPHQANDRISLGIAKKLGVDPSVFYRNISRYGNTSAGTIPIALGEMFTKGLLEAGRGDKIILAGFGGGLTWGSLLIQI